MTDQKQLVEKTWNYCVILRDNGGLQAYFLNNFTLTKKINA